MGRFGSEIINIGKGWDKEASNMYSGCFACSSGIDDGNACSSGHDTGDVCKVSDTTTASISVSKEKEVCYGMAKSSFILS